MKFGNRLPYVSTPEWAAHNVDYDDIKQLIKDRTTSTSTNAIAIPGQSRSESENFLWEQELYDQLCSQHERVELFYKATVQNIKGRLGECTQDLGLLESRSTNDGTTGKKTPAKQKEKFSQLEGDVLKVGEAIQNFSRYVEAQKLAFQKLLKKNRKWSQSTALDARMSHDVFKNSKIVHRKEINSLFTQYSQLLAAVRSAFIQSRQKHSSPADDSLSPQRSSDGKRPMISLDSAAPKLHSATRDLEVDFDIALATIGSDSQSGRATYFVHEDNLIQAMILIQAHLSIRRSAKTPSTPRRTQRSAFVRTMSSESLANKIHDIEDYAGTMYCDDIKEALGHEPQKTNSKNRSAPGLTWRPRAMIKLTRDPVAIAVVQTLPELRSSEDSLKKWKLKPKQIPEAFAADRSETRDDQPPDSPRSLSDATGLFVLKTWLQKHRDVQPLVQIDTLRSRFVGLKNEESRGIWATFDRDITISATSTEALQRGVTRRQSASKFPHAVLDIRWEGQRQPTFIKGMDESHLTHRIEGGFSLELHALMTLYSPSQLSSLPWFSALEKDIRQTPTDSKKPRRIHSPQRSLVLNSSRPSTSTTIEPVADTFSTKHALSSSTSCDEPTSPPSIVRSKKMQGKRRRVSPPPLREPSQVTGPRRYWSEFNHGDDGPDTNGVYTIYVDPDEPGPVSDFFKRLGHGARTYSTSVRDWFWRNPERPTGESASAASQQHDYFSFRPHHIDGSRSEPGPITAASETATPSTALIDSRQSAYATFPGGARDPAGRRSTSAAPSTTSSYRAAENAGLLRFAVLAYVASFLVAGVVAAVEMGIRHRGRPVANEDWGEVIGVTTSVMLATAGWVLIWIRRQGGSRSIEGEPTELEGQRAEKRRRWLGRSVGGAFWALAFLANALLVLAMVGRDGL